MSRIELSPAQTASPRCSHQTTVQTVEVEDLVCPDCVAMGSDWVHLRVCLHCGHVGCCDASPQRHATGHFDATGHPIVRSIEPGETWAWCYVDRTVL